MILREPARERIITWSDPRESAAATRELTGLELLMAVRDGTIAPPPVGDLIGMSFTDVEAGRVVMRLTPAEYHYNPLGTVHGGILATLLDSVMGCAVHTTLPRGRSYTTLEIKVNYIRAVTAASGGLAAEGKVVHTGRRSAVAEGKLTDAEGRLCATASTTCMVFDIPAG